MVRLPTFRQLSGDDVPFGELAIFAATEELGAVGAPAQIVDASVGVSPDEAVVKLPLGEAVEQNMTRVRSPRDQMKAFHGGSFGRGSGG